MLSSEESACQCRRRLRHEFNRWVGKKSPGGENGNPLPYSCWENFMDRGARQVTLQGSQRVMPEQLNTHTHIP